MATKESLYFEIDSNLKSVVKDQGEWNREIKKTKDNIEDVNKEGKEVVAEMNILGVSINGLKAGWKSAASGAKFMFRSIKMGIISTGIGVFVVALGSLATWFAKTKKGAEFLETALSGIGAAFNVIGDRIAKFGGGLMKLLTNTKGGLKDMKDSFKGIGTEIQTDVLLTMALTKQNQKLADSQRELSVETAKRRADIEELKLIAEDTTKAEAVRLQAARDAFKIENDLLERNIANAEKAVELEKARHRTIEPMKEDLDALAQLEIELANIRGESTTKQIELNNKINSIEAETAAKRKENSDARIQQLKDEQQAAEDLYNAQIAQANAWEQKVKSLADKEKAEIQSVEDFKRATINVGFAAAQALAGKNAGLSKAVAAAQTIYSTQQGIMAALAATSPADKLMPYPLRLANAISVGVMGAAALANIMSTDPMGGSLSTSGTPSPSAQTPAPQMMSGTFELGGGIKPEPMQAYVVSDDITNNQNKLATIRRRATI